VQSALVGAGGLVVEVLFSLSFFFFFSLGHKWTKFITWKRKRKEEKASHPNPNPTSGGMGNCLV
jgi:UDP-N-acetylmuramyl pentapeptide phosphotransferase/UDP-N-acetylglucosamine-1-phosphate transferase